MFLIKTQSNPTRWLVQCQRGIEAQQLVSTRREANILLSRVIREFPNAEVVEVEVKTK